eukprot:TRINITY_DN109444_c0_g1_i1.p1 TRINITY_DN109444_c0_g1~~TRINITY_DN109444_c0_g1_i1.p1  ORF type:complete len:288 (+),score=32.20 TRINITY_DN109444_c0_g1_i1:65-928(+)
MWTIFEAIVLGALVSFCVGNEDDVPKVQLAVKGGSQTCAQKDQILYCSSCIECCEGLEKSLTHDADEKSWYYKCTEGSEATTTAAATTTTTRAAGPSPGKIRWTSHPGNCVSVSSATDGASAQSWDCSARPGDWLADGYRFKWANDPTKCLDLDSGETSNGAKIQIWNCQDSSSTNFDNQQWFVDGGQIKLKKRPSKCVDVAAGKTDNGAKIHLWDCLAGNENQMFAFEGTPGQSLWSCSECGANGFQPDQCGCGVCGSYGGCSWTCDMASDRPACSTSAQTNVRSV